MSANPVDGSAESAPDLLITGIGQLVDPSVRGGDDQPAIVNDAFVWIERGRIRMTGGMADLPAGASAGVRLDAVGAVALPGLVDSHTHAVFGATREHEFERRMEGATYQEIAREGGGILFSVNDLRSMSEDALTLLARPRLAAFAAWGATTVEVKSGYGLTTEDELKTLRVVARLQRDPGLPRLVATFLGAHAVPIEFARDRAAYVRLVCDEMLPAVADAALAEFCDVFCEEGAFSLDESEAILERGKALGFGLKIHAEEFTALGGAALAARMGAVSADHLVAIDKAGIAALADSGTVATLLPGTSTFLRLAHHAPGRALTDAGVPVALATDFNPGSSMTQNLLLMVALGCLQLGLTIPEALRGVTWSAARALGREDRGTFAVGALGDVALFRVPDARHLAYHYGMHPTIATVRGGRVIWRAPAAS